MKYLSLILSIFLWSSVSLTAAEGNTKTETFKVYGNCGMCKRTIEKAASAIQGVKSADWNMETDMMTVTYNTMVVTLDDIKKGIAASGYDTDTVRATDESYSKLHGCCQYDRPKS